MTLAVMQPYFFPYLGYFSLIKHSDQFILFDTVQFIRHGWIERNRVLKQNKDWLYIKVPLLKGKGRDTLIKDCMINNEKNWTSTIKAQLQHYKKPAPYYYKVMELLDQIFKKEYKTITELNKAALETICSYLGFQREIPVFSQMNLDIEEPKAADEWALNICKALQKDEKMHYINPIGGKVFFDKEKYKQNDIDISFHQQELVPYNQKRTPFEKGLSILDVLMFNSKEEVKKMLDNYQLI